MGGKSKTEKFALINHLPNVFQNFDYHKPVLISQEKEIDLKGKWRANYFKNDHPIVLELACGKGDYTTALASKFPNKNFIGVDVKGNRIWTGADYAKKNNLSNVAFLRTYIEVINCFFQAKEVDEIWITFPDPFRKKANKRLTHPHFFKLYRKITKPKAFIHFKTDDYPLFCYTKGVIDGIGYKCTQYKENIYQQDTTIDALLSIKTYYEKQHIKKGRHIHFLQCQL